MGCTCAVDGGDKKYTQILMGIFLGQWSLGRQRRWEDIK
jgi:hypothetical protein